MANSRSKRGIGFVGGGFSTYVVLDADFHHLSVFLVLTIDVYARDHHFYDNVTMYLCACTDLQKLNR